MNNVFKHEFQSPCTRADGETTITMQNMRGKITLEAKMPENIELITKFSELLTKHDYTSIMNHLNQL